VRLPKEFRLTGPEVEIFRRGDEIALRKTSRGTLRALEILAELPEDFRHELPDPPPKSHEEIW
jgi:antitoxin VapB